jgi:hypothetical protein
MLFSRHAAETGRPIETGDLKVVNVPAQFRVAAFKEGLELPKDAIPLRSGIMLKGERPEGWYQVARYHTDAPYVAGKRDLEVGQVDAYPLAQLVEQEIYLPGVPRYTQGIERFQRVLHSYLERVCPGEANALEAKIIEDLNHALRRTAMAYFFGNYVTNYRGLSAQIADALHDNASVPDVQNFDQLAHLIELQRGPNAEKEEMLEKLGRLRAVAKEHGSMPDRDQRAYLMCGNSPYAPKSLERYVVSLAGQNGINIEIKAWFHFEFSVDPKGVVTIGSTCLSDSAFNNAAGINALEVHVTPPPGSSVKDSQQQVDALFYAFLETIGEFKTK